MGLTTQKSELQNIRNSHERKLRVDKINFARAIRVIKIYLMF